MGLNDFISNVLQSWRKAKRKRAGEEDVVIVDQKRQKIANDYTLTPVVKDRNKSSENRENFFLGEELSDTESRIVEYKEGGFLFKAEVLTHHIRKYGSAFLNSEGGTLLAGVNDSGIVRGVYVSINDFYRINETLKYEMSQFRPFVNGSLFSCRTYPVVNNKRTFLSSHASNLCVVEFNFHKGIENELYETGDHQVFLRRDGGVQGPLRPLDIKNLVISKYNSTLKSRKEISKKEEEREVLKSIPQCTNTQKMSFGRKLVSVVGYRR